MAMANHQTSLKPLSLSVFLLGLVAFSAIVGAAESAKKAAPPAAAPAGSGGCSNLLVNLSPCVDYVLANDTRKATPTQDCCRALNGVINNNITCLCILFTNSSDNPLGQPVNPNKATSMSSKCKAGAPPVSTCNVIGVPVASPTGSPSANSPSSSSSSSSRSPSSENSKAPAKPSAKSSANSRATADGALPLEAFLVSTVFGVITSLLF
eukprot:TRINITY_DN22640_c0_g1_i1.p1 TRINITY_DN22640_c0_g1~~TRINITY_DN22640_c0_g1_i1.p1  ORF type:complete len:209 (+),score=19.73 TRINITY_DN22640_c0_g1_i1:170-796(+)